MKISIFLKTISILLLSTLIATTITAQSKHQKAIQRSLKNKSVEISMDTVFYIGESWFVISEKASSALSKVKELKTLDGNTVASITKAFNGTYGVTSTFFIEFPSVVGNASLVKSGLENCIQELFNNNVFKNKELDIAAANTFMQAYKYVEPVYTDPTPTTNTYNTPTRSTSSYPQTNTSPKPTPKPASTQPSTPSSVSFTLKNKSGNTVKYFIGTDPKFGSGRSSSASGNSISTEHGTVGHKICIVDGSGNPISCTTITNPMNTVYINSKGNGFGDF